MAKILVTRESIETYLESATPERRAAFIGRALVHLLNRQTEAEAKNNTTDNHNMRGFTPADARSGCIGAKYFLKNRTLQDWQIEAWMRPGAHGMRIAKYWRQLNEEAQKKAERSAA
jgi:hypothetical protein